MAKKINFKIITPEKTVYQDEVDKISVPTADGVISIRPEHMLLVSIIEAGRLVVTKEKRDIDMAITRGFIEVRQDSEVVIMADTAERIEEMDKEAIEKAKDRAKKALEDSQNEDEVEFARLEQVFAREMSRLNILSKYKK